VRKLDKVTKRSNRDVDSRKTTSAAALDRLA
jgi:hypothetical protein